MRVAVAAEHLDALMRAPARPEVGAPGDVDARIRHQLRAWLHTARPADAAPFVTAPPGARTRDIRMGAHLERDIRRFAARALHVTPAAVIRAAIAAGHTTVVR